MGCRRAGTLSSRYVLVSLTCTGDGIPCVEMRGGSAVRIKVGTVLEYLQALPALPTQRLAYHKPGTSTVVELTPSLLEGGLLRGAAAEWM